MGSISLPALAVQPPQQQNPIQGLHDFLAMRAQQNQAALAQEEIKGEQQKNEAQGIAVQQQKQQLSLAPQFTQKDDSGKVTGFDQEGYFNALMGSGAMKPQDVYAAKANIADSTKKLAEAGAAQIDLTNKRIDQGFEILEGVRATAKQPGITPDVVQSAYENAVGKARMAGLDVSKLPTVFPGDAGLTAIEAQLGASKQIVANAKELAATKESQAKTGEAEATANEKNATAAFYNNNPTLGAPGVPPETVQIADFLAKNPGKTPADFAAWKAQQVASAEAPTKIAAAAAEGAARANTEINTKRQETSDAQFQTAMGADERLNRMEKSYTDAVGGNQQAMLALLSDHIGMTMGLQKGARITKDIIQEAAKSQPWIAGLKAKFDSDGYLSGVTLSPNQMKQMLDLGYSARENAWDNARSTSQLYNVAPPPNAQQVYQKRDPNQRIYSQSSTAKDFGAAPAGKAEGSTGKLPDGTKVIVKNGRIVAQ